MILDFPSNPQQGDQYILDTKGWEYDGTAWVALSRTFIDTNAFVAKTDVDFNTFIAKNEVVVNVGEPNAGGGLIYNEQNDGSFTYTPAEYPPKPIYTGDTAPTSPISGDVWLDTTIGKLYVYLDDGTSSQWVQPSFTSVNKFQNELSSSIVSVFQDVQNIDFTGTNDTSGLFLTSDGDSSFSFTEKIRIGSNGNTVFTGNIAQYNPNLRDTNGSALSLSGPLGGSDIYSSHLTLLAAETSITGLELYTYWGDQYGKISFGNVGVAGNFNPVEQATISSYNNGIGDGGNIEFLTKAIGGSLTQRMTITESGEVRIGDYLNTAKLEVAGDIDFTGGLNLKSDSNTVQWTIDRDESQNLIFSYQGADKMKLDTSGNLTEVSKLASTGKAIAMSIVFG